MNWIPGAVQHRQPENRSCYMRVFQNRLFHCDLVVTIIDLTEERAH